jgi:DNA-binding beta-propeller fold protein YncE
MSASPAVNDSQSIPGAGPAPIDGTEAPPENRKRKVLVLLLLLLLLMFLLGLAIWYLLFRQPIPLPTIPGEVVMPGYSTSLYGAQRPMDVAVTASGDRIYVGETEGDNTARVLDAQGNQLALMQPPVSTGTSHAPVYLAINPLSGEVYVSDRPTGSVYVYDAQGTYLRTFEPLADDGSWQPLGLWFDPTGDLYVVDVGSTPNVVRVFDPSGEQLRTYGESAGMSFPNDVATDSAGYVYVTDSNNGRLLVFAPDGTQVGQVGRGAGAGNLGLPRGVAVDGTGRVYVADATGQSVSVFKTFQEGDARPEFLGSFGAQGVANGTFSYPNGIAVDGRGRLYIADSANDRVQLWSY